MKPDEVGRELSWLPDQTADEWDAGWGDWREERGNDERLREDVPPHW